MTGCCRHAAPWRRVRGEYRPLPTWVGAQREKRCGLACMRASGHAVPQSTRTYAAPLTFPDLSTHSRQSQGVTPESGGGAHEERNGEREQHSSSSSSRYIGVFWQKASSSWLSQLYDPKAQRSRHIGYYASEEDAARAYDCAAVQAGGPGAKRNFPGVVNEPPLTVGEERKQRSSSRYIGVTWNKAGSIWKVQLTNPQTKRDRFIGYCASEEDAARAYDCAAVQAHGSGAERNFPDEAINELPVTPMGDERKQRSSSRYVGVCWDKAKSSWRVQLYDTRTKRQRRIGYFASEDDAARAYDCAAVQAGGPGAKRNFPGEDISEPPVTVGEERKQRSSSHYIGVCWDKAKSSWDVRLADLHTKRRQRIGYFASEEDAARAYDCAAVQAGGPGVKRNFPGEDISEPPVTVDEERKRQKS
jgi:hypothetical protein